MKGRAAFLALAVLIASTPATADPMRRAVVAQGRLAGQAATGSTAFLGIPFAASPIGDRRWRAPQPAAGWEGVRDARQFGASCLQNLPAPGGFGPWTPEYLIEGPASEDCLFLNVWTPAVNASTRLPVLVWIHGGAFREGSGSVPIYDGAMLAARGILVVTINYRLGVFGFLSHPGLRAENPQGAAGNYGLQDQVAALQWVQRNITAFGGDPRRVTIAGQSAGAASVHHLMASPLTDGLFLRAIAQSGSGMGLAVPDGKLADAAGVELMKALGASDIAALRRIEAARILEASNRTDPRGGSPLRFGPSVDGLVLERTADPLRARHDLRMLTGMTANEMTGLNPQLGSITPEAWSAQLRETYGALAPRAQALYPAKDPGEASRQLDAHARDRGLAAMGSWAAERAKSSQKPAFAYLWTHAEPGPESSRYRAFHSSEIPYVFGTLDKASARGFTPADHALSRQIGEYWANFVKNGDPNGNGLAAWPAYSVDVPRVMELDASPRPVPLLAPERFEFFRAHQRSGGSIGLF